MTREGVSVSFLSPGCRPYRAFRKEKALARSICSGSIEHQRGSVGSTCVAHSGVIGRGGKANESLKREVIIVFFLPETNTLNALFPRLSQASSKCPAVAWVSFISKLKFFLHNILYPINKIPGICCILYMFVLENNKIISGFP